MPAVTQIRATEGGTGGTAQPGLAMAGPGRGGAPGSPQPQPAPERPSGPNVARFTGRGVVTLTSLLQC